MMVKTEKIEVMKKKLIFSDVMLRKSTHVIITMSMHTIIMHIAIHMHTVFPGCLPYACI